jgi:RAB protein geranylgeranyltransferase component A
LALSQLLSKQDGLHTASTIDKATCCRQGISNTYADFHRNGDRKLNDIQVRFEKLPNVFSKFESAQSELELSDDVDYSGKGEVFESQYFEVKAKCNEMLHPVVNQPRSRQFRKWFIRTDEYFTKVTW